MKRFVEGENRSQSTLFPESLDDYIAEDNPVRVVDVFVVGYNVQAAVDAKHHLIATHEVTNLGHDRSQLSPIARSCRRWPSKHRMRSVKKRS